MNLTICGRKGSHHPKLMLDGVMDPAGQPYCERMSRHTQRASDHELAGMATKKWEPSRGDHGFEIKCFGGKPMETNGNILSIHSILQATPFTYLRIDRSAAAHSMLTPRKLSLNELRDR